MNFERANIIVATRTVPTVGTQALVGRKMRGDFAGMITFPGGKLEWDGSELEDKGVAAQREFLEETGIDVDLDQLRLAGRIRLYGDRFGLIDIFHTKAATTQPVSSDEIKLHWRTIDHNFYRGMPEDTQEWLPLVFSEENFRVSAAWNAGRLCMLAESSLDTLLDVVSYFGHAGKEVE